MPKAFCPGHITCFFHPVRTDDVLTTGSRGAGIRLSKGAFVTLEERSDSKIEVTMDGVPSEAKVTRKVLELIRPGEGFDVTIENELPVSQGFGMSAAGAIAVSLAAIGEYSDDIFRYAHMAEVSEGGGLGDVTALMCPGHQPVRERPGLPPSGSIIDTGLRFENLTLAVFGDKLNTGSVINDPDVCSLMDDVGRRMVDSHLSDPSIDGLFRKSREFSRSVGLESLVVGTALDLLEPCGHAGMCMLGHSIFTDVPKDEVFDLFGDVPTYTCSSTDAMPRLL